MARTSFNQRLGTVHKRHNKGIAHDAKITIRQNVLDAIGAENARVFDAFAGEGYLYRAVWHQAAEYVGCDLAFVRDERMAFVADNQRVLRAIDLSRFNIFDCDAHGSPWEQLYVIAKRRTLLPGETVGIVLTDGAGLTTRFNGMVRAMALVAGVDANIAGMSKNSNLDWLFKRAVHGLADLMGARLTQYWQAIAKHGTRVHYIGIMLKADPG